MKLTALLFFSVLTILLSCDLQTTKQKDNPVKLNVLAAIGDTVKELGNNIMVIYQDSKANYWFGSWQDGLYKYDGKSIIHFTTKDGLASNRVEEIKEDKRGNIYLNTSKGLCQFNGVRFSTRTEALSIGTDWTLNPDDLWFKCLTHPNSVYRFDGNNLYILKIPKTKLGEDYIQKHPSYPDPYAVYCIYKDSKDNIWFGTATLGVFRFNGKSFDWISEEDLTEIHDGPANGVRSIAEDEQGYFWFNTDYKYRIYNNKATIKRDIENQTFYDRIKSIGSLDGKRDGNLSEYLSITKDNNHELWIATYNAGVYHYNGRNIVHHSVKDDNKEITLFSIYKDNVGQLWLGTHEAGAYKFNGKTFERFKIGPQNE
jgi:ligand-binding sensor domain-containing protein